MRGIVVLARAEGDPDPPMRRTRTHFRDLQRVVWLVRAAGMLRPNDKGIRPLEISAGSGLAPRARRNVRG
jgi:hypothetical protein